jgi:gliding motility-associated-like protein
VINPLPAVTAGNDSPICEGAALNLTSSGGNTYSWTGPNGFTSTLQNPSFAVSTSTVSGTYTVTATDAIGCSNTATTTVIFSPAFPLVPGSDGTVCEGAAIHLTVDTGVSWSWSGPAGFTSTLQNPVIATATMAMAGTYTVAATNAFGCVSRDSVDVNVNALPTVSIANNGPVCELDTIHFLAGGGVSYSWNGPNSFTSTLLNPSISNASTAAAGTYTVSVTDLNSCTNSATTTVIVNALPAVVASGNAVCENGTISLTASGGNTYSWSGPGGYSSPAQNPAIPSATTAMSGTYTVTVTGNNLCVNTQTTNVLVNPLPAVNPVSNTPVCENNPIDLNASGGSTYAWSGPNGFTSGNQNPQLPSATMMMTGTYSVTVTDLFGCVNSGTTSVVVNTSPVPSAGNSGPVCELQQLNLFSSPGFVQYVWSGPNGFNSTLANVSIAAPTVADAGTYTLTVADAIGCTGLVTTMVVINPIPVISASANSPVCIGSTINLSAAPSGMDSYTWSGPAGFAAAGQNTSVPGATASSAGVYTLTAGSGGCNSQPVSVTVVVRPPLVVNANATTISVCEGGATAISAAGHGGDNNLTYTWNPGGETGMSISPTSASTTIYTVTLTDGCGTPLAWDTVKITVNPTPVVSFSQAGGQCAPVAITFMGSSAPVAASCVWDFGDGTTSTDMLPMHVYETAGTYTVGYTATTAAGCTASTSMPMDLYESPVADFTWSQQQDEILEPVVYFENNSTGSHITDYNWTLGVVDTGYYSIFNPSPVSYPGAGAYPVSLTVVNQWGCSDTMTQIVKVEETPAIYVPAAFSPNGDALNEYFAPKGVGINQMEMFIFDRWGHQLFHSKDLDAKWDGTYKGKTELAPPDVYIWKIIIVNSLDLEREYNGHVTLLR